MNIFTCIEILVFFILLVPVWLLSNSYGWGNYLRIVVTLLDVAYLIYVRYQFFEVSADKKAIGRIVGSALAILLLFAVTGWKTLLELFG
jgi:heme O synthase-like polyprenyltransferase